MALVFDSLRRLSGHFSEGGRASRDATPDSLPTDITGLPSSDTPFTAALFEECSDLRFQCLHNPFVQGLVQGVVPRDVRDSYVSDDCRFLQSYKKLYEAALARTPPNAPQEIRDSIEKLLKSLNDEMTWINALMEPEGESEAVAAADGAADGAPTLVRRLEPSPAAKAYMSFLDGIVSRSETSSCEIIASMAPCMRLYAWLGWRLVQAFPDCPGPWSAWLKEYGRPSFWASARESERALEGLMRYAKETGQKLEASGSPGGLGPGSLETRVRALYREAMELELAFFRAPLEFTNDPKSSRLLWSPAAGLGAGAGTRAGDGATPTDFAPPPPPSWTSVRRLSLVVTDFEGTCTPDETLPLIASLAADQEGSGDDHSGSEGADQSGRGLGPPVRRFERRIASLLSNSAEKREAFLREVLPSPRGEGEAADAEAAPAAARAREYDPEWLMRFIDRVEQYETDVNREIVQARVTAHVRRTALLQAAQRVDLRPRCVKTLRRLQRAGVSTCVLSMSWSGLFVASALRFGGLEPVAVADGGDDVDGEAAPAAAAPQPHSHVPRPDAVTVYANEMEFDEGGWATGNISWACQSGASKNRQFEDCLLGTASNIDGVAARDEGLSVYIGDSMTDIHALVSADIGILFGTNALARRVAAAAGVRIQPLDAAPLGDVRQEGRIFTAQSWDEIHGFLFAGRFDLRPVE